MKDILEFEIIDFHTHPFADNEYNICSHTEYCDMSVQNTKKLMDELHVSKIAGSVLSSRKENESVWEYMERLNGEAKKLHAQYGDFYIPGFHVHPGAPRQSCEAIERLAREGYKLIGELVPYWVGWEQTYASKEFLEILDVCDSYNMVVSFHTMWNDELDTMVKEYPNIVFVSAHPGEYGDFMRHMERMKYSENYYLDVSGYGMFRHGMLRHAIDEFGAERFLYGSDYPTCNPAMYIGGVLLDPTIKDEEKKLIFADNAKRILGIE